VHSGFIGRFCRFLALETTAAPGLTPPAAAAAQSLWDYHGALVGALEMQLAAHGLAFDPQSATAELWGAP
jgi:hypothetical protein